MASIAKEANGNRRILFVAPDGRRPTIRLGKVSQRTAEAVKFRVEQLVAAKLTGHAADPETLRWVANLEPAMAKKLSAAGLIAAPEKQGMIALGDILQRLIADRKDVKATSKIVWGQVRKNLESFFGSQCNVRSITPGDADRFKQSLVSQGLAATTIHKRLQHACAFFRAMTRRKLVDVNVFEGIKHPSISAAERQYFVTRAEIEQVLEACPDRHWRLIVSLSRYGGLRCPSEVLSLRWADIDWANDRIRIQSPKTEHIPGKASRVAPLFPELRQPLSDSFEAAPDGAIYVIPDRFRKALGDGSWANCNLRTTFEKIIFRAGLTPWPRLFQNLRASRENRIA